jgi:hypothetical protein
MNCCIEGMDLHLVQNLLHWGERGKWRRRGGGGRKGPIFYILRLLLSKICISVVL